MQGTGQIIDVYVVLASVVQSLNSCACLILPCQMRNKRIHLPCASNRGTNWKRKRTATTRCGTRYGTHSVRRTPLASLQEEGDDEPDGDDDDSAAKTKAKSNANSVLIKLFIGDAIRPRKLE